MSDAGGRPEWWKASGVVDRPEDPARDPLDESSPSGSAPTDPPTAEYAAVRAPAPPATPDRTRRRRRWLLGAAALVVAAAVVVVVVFALPKSGPSFHVKKVSLLPVGQDAAKVITIVKNSGGSTGTPTCTILASVAGHPGSGSGTFTERQPIDPGTVVLYINTISITDGAASLLKPSDVSVSCH